MGLGVLGRYLQRKDDQAEKQHQNNVDYSIRQTAYRVHGFVPDVSRTFWENRSAVLGAMTPHHYFTRPSNTAFHNLCKSATLPDGTANLLGLGLTFCIESPRPTAQTRQLATSVHRLRRSVRLHALFKKDENDDSAGGRGDESSYIPKLYIPSKWKPPAANIGLEVAVDTFDRKLSSLIRQLPTTRRYNLSPAQRNCLSTLVK
jgi:hypothetical protein